jgi:hypothetical protein
MPVIGRRPRGVVLTVLLASLALAPGRAAAASFYVSPDTGSDANPGTQARPFATLQRAQQAVRGVAASMSDDTVVWLREGLYRLPRPLRFGPEDSGTNGFFVRYKAYPDERPIVSGGFRLTGWRVSGDPARNIYVASARGQRFRQLYVGDTHGVRARYPAGNTSANYLRAAAIFPGDDGYLRMDVESSLLPPALRATLAGSGNRHEVEIVMYYPFLMSRLRILRGGPVADTTHYRFVIAAPDGQLEIARAGLTPNRRYTSLGQSFHLENHAAFLTEPTAWYLDPVDDLVYFRAPDHVMSSAGVEALGIVAPMGRAGGDNETLVSIEGRAETGEPVRNLTFEGLVFAHTNWLGPSESGFVGARVFKRYMRSGSVTSGIELQTPPAAVELNHTEHIAFIGNVFQDLGASGIRVGGITRAFRAVGNAFLEVNGNGIEAEGRYAAVPKDGFRIESNRFRVIGWDYQSVAILAAGIRDLKIRQNEIDFTTDAGILTRGGGSGTAEACHGAGPLSGVTGNEISANVINRPTQHIIDMGAIYNPCKQTLAITYNRITNISPPAWYSTLPWVSRGGIGVYLDYASSGVTVRGNTIQQVPNPFLLNCESGNLVTNNRTDLAPGTESAATPRRCDGRPRVYGPSSTLVTDSNASTVPAIPDGVLIGMRPADVAFLGWLAANINRNFPSTPLPGDAAPDRAGLRGDPGEELFIERAAAGQPPH